MTNGALALATSPYQTESSPRFERVLFTTDFSETSLRALPLAAAVTRTFGSELKIVYGLTPGDQVCAVPEFTTGVTTIVASDADDRLRVLKKSAELEGLTVKTEVYQNGIGSVAQEIAEDDVDLVVMATHGSRGIRHLLLGSVAEEVTHTAAPPVLTLGPHASPTADSEFHPKHILFATDATPDSFRALPSAIQFASKRGSGLTLAHVLQRKVQKSPDAEAFAVLMRDGLHNAIPLTVIKACSPEILVRFGDPVKEILDIARDRGTELIIMGARSNNNRATFSRSVSYGVIAQAPCPVLTIRGREK